MVKVINDLAGSGPWWVRQFELGMIQEESDRAVREEAKRAEIGREAGPRIGRTTAVRFVPLIGAVVVATGCIAGRPHPAPGVLVPQWTLNGRTTGPTINFVSTFRGEDHFTNTARTTHLCP